MILLDTQSLVWWIGVPDKISARAKKAIKKEAKNKILVSAISIWETCLLVKKDKLDLSMEVESWIENIEKIPYFEFIPVDNEIASKSVMLPEPFHKDPADRIIVATARQYGATIITSDEKIRKYPHVQSVW